MKLMLMFLMLPFVTPFVSGVKLFVTPNLTDTDCHIADAEPCYTLDWYAQNISKYITNESVEVTMLFLGGAHNLTQDMTFSNISKLEWRDASNLTGQNTLVTVYCDAGLDFSEVPKIILKNLTLRAASKLCKDLHLYTTKLVIEHASVVSMILTMHTDHKVLLSHSYFLYSSLNIQIDGASGERDVTIKYTLIYDSPQEYSLIYDDRCDACQTNLTLDNMLTQRSTLNSSDDNHLLDSGDLLLLVKLYAPHKINITECSFKRSPGTGITFIINMPQPQLLNHTNSGEIILKDTEVSFHRIGGVLVWYQDQFYHSKEPPKLTITRCEFSHNTVASVAITTPYPGSALSILGPIYGEVLISSTSFHNNIDIRSKPLTVFISDQDLTIVDSDFTDNVGTALSAFNSNIYFTGNVSFMNNTAIKGAGLYLTGSYIHLRNHTNVTFYNNQAQQVGGAVVIKEILMIEDPDSTHQKCFYQLDQLGDSSTSGYKQSIYMINNTANDGGDHIYGGSLQSQCLVTERPLQSRMSYQVWKDYFHFETHSDLSVVSSDHMRVCLCDEETDRPDCSNLSLIFHHGYCFPGETIKISAVLVGNDFGLIEGTVYAHFIPSNTSEPSLQPLEDAQRVSHDTCNQLQYTVRSSLDNETLLLTAFYNTPPKFYDNATDLSIDIDTYNTYGYVPSDLLHTPVYIFLSLLPCPPGFVLLDDACECDPTLRESNIGCLIQNQTGYIRRSGTLWVSASYSGNTSDGVVVEKYCPNQYCKDEEIFVDLENPDIQCAFNRAGVLCGQCQDGLSIGLGSQTCRDCTNNRGLALLLLFILAGIVLVCFIKVLDLTVTQATINGLIFYANIVWAYQNILFPETKKTLLTNVLKVFVAWLNLDFGIETCFVQGLDAYWKTWLQFIFPLYIWAIVGLIILSCRKSAFMTKVFGKHSVHLLATLFLLSYSKLLRTIIIALECTNLNYPHGRHVFVWSFDGNVPYFASKHAPLFIVAFAALLFLWLPYTLTLLLFPWLKKVSHLRPFRWINTLKPLFDAYFGPLKDKHQYWIGLLLLVRGFLFVLLTSTSAISPGANLLVVVIVSALLLLHPDVYKQWYVSLLEKSFLCNLIVLCAGIFYVELVGGSRETIICPFLGIAFVQFVAIVIYHAFKAVRKRRVCRRGQQTFQDKNKDDREDLDNEVLFVRLRESLLETDD